MGLRCRAPTIPPRRSPTPGFPPFSASESVSSRFCAHHLLQWAIAISIALTRAQVRPRSFISYLYEEIIMKIKLTALILALTVASWAQTTTPNPSAPAPQENTAPQAKADCCHKTASGNEGQSCCRHEMGGKDEKAMSCSAGEKASPCCGGKETKSCMKDDKDKT